MDIWMAVIFGVVEGITEFLPISSTGHLILLSKILKVASTDYLKTFQISIQLGAILAVVVLFWKRFFLNWQVWKRVLVAFVPAAVVGYFFYGRIKHHLLGNETVVLWALFLGGLFLIVFELFHKEKQDGDARIAEISYLQCFLIGIFQSISVIPGISRAAATIIGGLVVGLRRKAIVEFSFLLAVPTMMAAAALDLLKDGWAFTQGEFASLAVGAVTSFIVAILSIKFLLYFVKKHSFIFFGVYRIFLSVIFWFFVR